MKTEVIKVNPVNPETEKIKKATDILGRGGLVAFPTETVYGLAANLLNKKAVNRLYEVKKRPTHKPFSITVADKKKVEEFAKDISPAAYRLMDSLWPGPLTLVLKSKHEESPVVFEENIGIRIPNHNVALAIIKEANFPIVLPSANISGNPAPSCAEDVLRDFDKLINLVIDAGRCSVGKESTVLDVTTLPVKILRQGAIEKDKIDKIANCKTVLFVCTGNSCRSVMAKGLLEKLAKGNKNIEVLSGGITIGRESATLETISLLKEEGIDVSAHKTTLINADMIKRAELILTMERTQEDRVIEMVAEAKNRVYLLKEFVRLDAGGLEIKDPFGGDLFIYKSCFLDIKEAVKRVYELL